MVYFPIQISQDGSCVNHIGVDQCSVARGSYLGRPSVESKAETLQYDGVDMVGAWFGGPIEIGPTQLGDDLSGI